MIPIMNLSDTSYLMNSGLKLMKKTSKRSVNSVGTRTIYICDKCGKEFPEEEWTTALSSFYLRFGSLDDISCQFQTDLCSICLKELYMIMREIVEDFKFPKFTGDISKEKYLRTGEWKLI